MELFYSGSKSQLIGYGDAGYLSNPHKGRSQTSYLFVYRGIVIYCRCIKKILVATSSNHSEIITIHKKNSRVYMAKVNYPTHKKSGLTTIENSLTILFKDNIACIS